MKRPGGVVFSAVLLLLGSLLQLLMAVMMAFTGVFLGKAISAGRPPAGPAPVPMPSWIPVYMFALCLFFVALALWGVLTSVGLFRLRRWARYSILVIGGALALIGLISLLMTLVMLFVPMPVASGVDAAQVQSVQTITKVMFGAVALIYGVVTAVGISWLVYFNKKRVRELFAGAVGSIPQSNRPFLVSVLAVLNLIGAGGCVLMAFLPLPGFIFGLILYGWHRAAIYLVIAALQAAVGIGLWRLDEWGRKLALGVLAFGVVQAAVYLVRPSLLLRYTAEVNRIMGTIQSPLPAQFQTMIYGLSFGFSALFCIAIAAVLIHYRAAFRPPIEPQPGLPAGVQ
jgi:hypothetical protein